MIKIIPVIGGSIQTNSYLLEDNNEVICFDFVPEIYDIIKEKKYSLQMMFLTHIHFDHIEGLSYFQKTNNFTLYLSSDAFKFINDPKYNLASVKLILI